MTVATEFHDWSEHPSEEAKKKQDGSPALKHVRDHHLQRWGGMSLSVPSLYQPRPVSGGTKPSAHGGSAVDLRWDDPGPGRDTVVREMLPFYIQNSQELHIQAIHDYWGCRVWRANRSHQPAGGWKTQPVGSHDGKMGADWARWLHLEVNESGWGDDRSVEAMLASNSRIGRNMLRAGGQPGLETAADLKNGTFGMFPFEEDKPMLKVGDNGDHVLYAQCVIFFKAGGAVARDSSFGQQTKTRVMDLQRLFGLPDIGEVDSATWNTIDFLSGQ